MTATLTTLKKAKENRSYQLLGTVAFTSNYATGGDTLDLAPFNPVQRQPDLVRIEGIAGYKYEYDHTNKKILVRDFPLVTVVGGQGAASALQINPDSAAGVLGKTVATTRAIPGRTFGFSMDELAAGAYPAGVTGDTVRLYAVWFA